MFLIWYIGLFSKIRSLLGSFIRKGDPTLENYHILRHESTFFATPLRAKYMPYKCIDRASRLHLDAECSQKVRLEKSV